MLLAEKLKQLRKEKKISQKELSESLNMSERQFIRYELQEALPSADVIVKVAKFYNVSTDYLLLDNAPKNASLSGDPEIIKRIEQLYVLSKKDKEAVFRIIDGLTKKAKMEELAIS